MYEFGTKQCWSDKYFQTNDIGSCYVTQTDLELVVLPPQFPKCYNYRYRSACFAQTYYFLLLFLSSHPLTWAKCLAGLPRLSMKLQPEAAFWPMLASGFLGSYSSYLGFSLKPSLPPLETVQSEAETLGVRRGDLRGALQTLGERGQGFSPYLP